MSDLAMSGGKHGPSPRDLFEALGGKRPEEVTDDDIQFLEGAGWEFSRSRKTDGWHGINEQLGLRTGKEDAFDTLGEAVVAASALTLAVNGSGPRAGAGLAESAGPEEEPGDMVRGTDLADLALGALLKGRLRPFESVKEAGVIDREFLTLVKEAVGPKGLTSTENGICAIRIKPRPQLWVGSYAGQGPPMLEGLPLLDRIRRLVGVGKPGEGPASQSRSTDLEPAGVDILPQEGAGSPEGTSAIGLPGGGHVQAALFDYGKLPAEDREFVRSATGEIKQLVKRSIQDAVRAGQKLLEVRERIGYGNWLPYLEAEFGGSSQTASRLMAVYQRFGHQILHGGEFDGFNLSALYLFAAPSASEGALLEAKERAAQGEAIGKPEAQAILDRYRETEAAGQPDLAGLQNTVSVGSGGLIIGVCRVCGCTEGQSCVEDDGVSCQWAPDSNMTLCSRCQGLMATLGLDEYALRERLQSTTEEPESDHVSAEGTGVTGGDALSSPERLAEHLRSIGGLSRAEMLALGVMNTQIEDAVAEGYIEKLDDDKFHARHSAQDSETGPRSETRPGAGDSERRSPVAGPPAAQAHPEPGAMKRVVDSRLGFEGRLKGRELTVTYTYVPSLGGKVNVGVRVGRDVAKTGYLKVLLDSSKFRHPMEVLDKISEQIDAADKEAKALIAKAPVKKSRSAKRAPVKRTSSKAPARAAGKQTKRRAK